MGAAITDKRGALGELAIESRPPSGTDFLCVIQADRRVATARQRQWERVQVCVTPRTARALDSQMRLFRIV